MAVGGPTSETLAPRAALRRRGSPLAFTPPGHDEHAVGAPAALPGNDVLSRMIIFGTGWLAPAARMKLQSLIFASCLGSLACGAAGAQTASFTDSVGLSPPPGWFLQAPDADQLVLLGPDGVSLIILRVQQASLPAFYARLLQPIKVLEGDLIPQGRPQKEGELVTNSFIVSGLGPLSRARVAARPVSSGRILVAYGFTQSGREAELSRTLMGVLETTRLAALPSGASPARAPLPGKAGAAPDKPAGQWRREIAPGADRTRPR